MSLPLRCLQKHKSQLKLLLLLRHRTSPQPASIFAKLEGVRGGGRQRDSSDNNFDSFASLSNVTGEYLHVFHFLRKEPTQNPLIFFFGQLFLQPSQRGEIHLE